MAAIAGVHLCVSVRPCRMATSNRTLSVRAEAVRRDGRLYVEQLHVTVDTEDEQSTLLGLYAICDICDGGGEEERAVIVPI